MHSFITNLPSGSHFERLVNCQASHKLSIEARRLGQVAFEDSEAARQGTRIHEALDTGNLEFLSPEESELLEDLKQQEQTLLSDWKTDSLPLDRSSEIRLYLRREGHFLPILTGQPDLVFVQGNRALIVDRKLGRWRVADPAENWQLKIYAVLLSRSETQLEEITVAVHSPYFRYSPYTFGRNELDRIYETALIVLASLSDPPAPTPGSWCAFCPASLICPARRQETVALAVPVQELPTGLDAACLLETITRVEAVCEEIKAHYKAQLAADPECVPGWRLQSSVRRWIPHPQQALERLIEQFSISDFLACCSVKLAELETAWARKNNLAGAHAKASFNRLMEGVVLSKRTAPSLKAI
jgi:hypothetical protein